MSVEHREKGSPSGCWTQWRPMIRAVLAIGLIGGGLPAFGQSTFYNETRVLHRSGLACGGAMHCRTFKGRRHKLEPGRAEVLTFQCPDEAPYFAGWDTEHHEHIRATMLPRPPRDTGGVPTGSDSRLVILAENVGTGPGDIALFLGCSTEVPLATSVMTESIGIPSAAPTLQGGN